MARRRLLVLGLLGGLLVVAAAFVGVVLATSDGSGERVTVFSARSHYGEERPFEAFAARSGDDLVLFGGSASELYERLRAEGAGTRADVLVTVDGANLWRAKRAGLLRRVDSRLLDRRVPADLRDPDGAWYGLTLRARTIVRSTERVRVGEVDTYEELGDPRWRGRLCLRSGTSEYNVSFVADRLAKDGRARTERMLRRWIANDPEVYGSDADVLEAIAAGRCDVGLANSYYLGRELEEDPRFPVALVWADQKGRGTHVNLSGVGIARQAPHPEQARELLEFLMRPDQQAVLARNNHEFPVGPEAAPSPELARFGGFKRDPIDVDAAGRRLGEAVRLMNQVGWD